MLERFNEILYTLNGYFIIPKLDCFHLPVRHKEQKKILKPTEGAW